MVHSGVYLNKYATSIAPFSPRLIQKTALFCMFSLFNFASSFPRGQLIPFAPMCGRPCLRQHLISTSKNYLQSSRPFRSTNTSLALLSRVASTVISTVRRGLLLQMSYVLVLGTPTIDRCPVQKRLSRFEADSCGSSETCVRRRYRFHNMKMVRFEGASGQHFVCWTKQMGDRCETAEPQLICMYSK